MFKVTVTLTFDILTPKLIGIFFGSWPTKTPITASLSSVSFKLMSGQGFYAPGHCDIDL